MKWNEGLRNKVSVIIRRYRDRINFIASFIFFGSVVYHYIYGCMFCMHLFNFVYYVFLLLCMFRSRYVFHYAVLCIAYV